MESREKLELIHQAIQNLLADNKNKEASGDGHPLDDNDRLLLSRLLSELESLESEAWINQEEAEKETAGADGEAESKKEKEGQVDGGSTGAGTEEIVKEIREVKRQNIVTQCLVSALVVLTVAWQLSEVSLILKVRDGLSHPFRSLGSFLIGMLKGPVTDAQDDDKHQHPGKQRQQLQQIATPPRPTLPLKMPELPRVDLGLNGDEHQWHQ